MNDKDKISREATFAAMLLRVFFFVENMAPICGRGDLVAYIRFAPNFGSSKPVSRGEQQMKGQSREAMLRGFRCRL